MLSSKAGLLTHRLNMSAKNGLAWIFFILVLKHWNIQKVNVKREIQKRDDLHKSL